MRIMYVPVPKEADTGAWYTAVVHARYRRTLEYYDEEIGDSPSD
jgi:hypothetical protein